MLHGAIIDENTAKGMIAMYRRYRVSTDRIASAVAFAMDQPEGANVNKATMGPTAQRRYSMLPLSLKVQDYAGSEKISHLPAKPSSSDAHARYAPPVGDLTLHAPRGNLAFFHRDHGYPSGLVLLGRIVTG